MTIQQAIQKAIEGGWKTIRKNLDGSPSAIKETQEIHQVLLDPLFWQSLGSALGWEKEDKINYLSVSFTRKSWFYYWHRLLDYLSSGRTIEKFFEELK